MPTAPTADEPAPDDPTVDDAVGPSQTSAATAARKRKGSERRCKELVDRLPELDGPMLAALFECIVDEITDRARARDAEGHGRTP